MSDIDDFYPPIVAPNDGSLVYGSAWTFGLVQERLIEAIVMLWRLPDRERGWQRSGLVAKWPEIAPATGFDKVELAEFMIAMWKEAPDDVRRPPLTRAQLAEMEEALGWMRFVPEGERRLVALAISALARGDRQVPWRALLKPMGLARGADGLRKRYGRALAAIAGALNSPDFRTKICQA